MKARSLGFIAAVLLALTGFSSQAQQSGLPEDTFTLDDLNSLIQQNKISSVETLLPMLPENFRSNTIFVYGSQSTQYADPLNPRAILYSPTSSLILAINSGAAPDSERVELIQFDSKKRAFRFYEGDFAGGKPALILPRTDCARCHRDDLRPNWQAYFQWTGVYGSDDGMLDGKLAPPEEAQNFKSFMEKAAKDPRYQYLSQTSLHVNLEFTQIQENRNFARVARILKASPHYNQFKYAYLGALLCPSTFDTFLPDSVKPVPAVSTWTGFLVRPDGIVQRNPLYYLFDIQGMHWGDYSMSFKTSYSDFDPYFTTPGYAEAEMAYVFLADMPEMMNKVDISPGYTPYPYTPNATIKEGECETVADLSRKALMGYQPVVAPSVLPPPARVLNSLSSCISCHVGNVALAPPIPFNDEIALKKRLSAKQSDLYDEIMKRIASDAPEAVRMPPSGILEQTDRETIRSYVDALMR